MIINLYFLLLKVILSAIIFDIRDIKWGNWEQQIDRNGKLNIYLENNFNLLVMNVTQLNVLY